MKREVSNSMSKENDPKFEVITPVCAICKNGLEAGKCRIYGDCPKEYKWAKKYDCPSKNIDTSDYWYETVKDKL